MNKKNGFGQKALLMLVFLAVTVSALAQSATGKLVTLNMKSAPVSKVLVEIKRQTGLNFIYNASLEKDWPKVNIRLKNKPASSAISKIADIIGCTYTVNGTVVTLAQQQVSQARRSISGTVRDKEGNPIVGAPVRVSGTSIMTLTDVDGHYEMSIPQSRSQLKISYVGMDDQNIIVAEGRQPLHRDFTMTDANNLSEVVVTGYQTISKERATGAFDKVDSDMLAARPGADLSSSLQGLVAGMQSTENEDGTMSFRIRGTSTLLADAKPLVVVDGFPIEGDFSSINPNDVESVTVLKDAAAASIWGTRSANGVIVVTTKRGRSKKLKVEGQGFVRIGTNPDLDYIINQATSQQFVDYELMGLKNGWDMGGQYFPSEQNLTSPLSLVSELYFGNKYYGLSDADMNAGLDRLRNTSNRSQLKKYLMQRQLLQQYNVNISGGTDKMDNFLSLMYEKSDEATINRGYERFMFNYNNTYKFNRFLTGTVGATLQKRNTEFSGVTVNEFGNLNPYELIKNDDGSYAHEVYGDASSLLSTGFNTFEMEKADMSKFPYPDMEYNMLREVNDRFYQTKLNNYRVQLGLNAKIIKGLEYDIKYQYERSEAKTKQLDNDDSFYVRSMCNIMTDYFGYSGTPGTCYLPTGAVLRRSSTIAHDQVLRHQLSYSNIFADKHSVSAIAGMELSEYVTEYTREAYTYGYDPETNTAKVPLYGSETKPGDLLGYIGRYFWPSRFYLNPAFSGRTDRYLSYFGNVAYDFDDRYGISFSIRSDGSNFVSKDASLRWTPMWSIGGKWNISNEKFMKDVDWVDRLALRATYGLNGNAEKSTSPQTLLSLTSNSVVGGNVASVASYGNPLLTWETTRTTNIGVDFSLFHHILSGKVDLYNRNSKDVIGDVSIPSAYGSKSQRFNNAKINNKGIEVELDGRYTFQGTGLSLNSSLTFAYNKNKITKLYHPQLYCYELSDGAFVEGKPISPIYSFEFAGTEDGIPYVYGPNGTKGSFNDFTVFYGDGMTCMKYGGTTIAPYTMGWSNEVSWNGLSLRFFLTGMFGHVFRAPSPTIPVANGTKISLSAQITDTFNSDGTKIPTFPNENEFYFYRWDRYMPILDYYVEKADFIKLKEISLSYQMPAKWMHAIHLQQAKVFCQMQNLGCLYTANKYDYDPEFLPGTNKPAMTITLGANIVF